jgi:hypothetical protein
MDITGLRKNIVTSSADLWIQSRGSAVIKHYQVRMTLWLNGHTPFKFVKFSRSP